MQRKKHRRMMYGRALFRRLCLIINKLKPKETQSLDDNCDHIPFRFKIFLFWASKFSSEKVKINLIGDLIEEYKLIILESNQTEANNWLNQQISSTLWTLLLCYFIRQYDHLKANAHSVSSVIFLISIIYFLIPFEQRQRTSVETDNQNRSIYEEQTNITSVNNTLLETNKALKNTTPVAKNRRVINTPTKTVNPPANSLASVTLRPYSITRSSVGNKNEVKRIAPQAPRVRFLLILPDESYKGLYDIAIVDPFGRSVSATTATSLNGRTLIFIVDTRMLTGGDYRISISDRVSAPIYYLFTVNRGNSRFD